MATWNSLKPLLIPKPEDQRTLKGNKELKTSGDSAAITYGQKVPEVLLTGDFIAGHLSSLAGLTMDEWGRFEHWKTRQRREVAGKWDGIMQSPRQLMEICPSHPALGELLGRTDDNGNLLEEAPEHVAPQN